MRRCATKFARVLAFAVILALASTQALAHSAAYTRPRWSWPTGQPVQVIKGFDPPSQPWLTGHRGIDLQVPYGTAIQAVESGRVIYAGQMVDRGVVSIEHADGLRSTYEPVDPTVSVGDMVTTGQKIGILAAYSRVKIHGPDTLHLGAKIGPKQYVDPLLLLIGEISLKPWT